MMQSRSSLAAAIMIAIALIVIYATRGSHGPEPSVPGRSPSKEDTARTFDYYALVLGWAPTYCLNQGALRNDAECDEHTSRAFTLHGLWPQYEKGWPENCHMATKPWVSSDVIARMRDIMPSRSLVIHEYRAHGTCSGLNPERYFAVSRQLYDNAISAAGEARADVQAQAAALRSAQIDLDRTVIRAPISGRIGRSLYTTGALVRAGQDNALTTIQRLDPIYVDIQQSSTDLLRLREQTLSGEIAGDHAPVRLQLESGSMYPLVGSLSFADVTVDQATGSQTIRAVFPNPQHLLLPGMFVRGQLSQGVQARGILIPQRGVSRDERGRPTVIVVGKNNMAELRVIQAARTVGNAWLVTGGLKPGEKVIVDAGPLLQPGAPVKPHLSRS